MKRDKSTEKVVLLHGIFDSKLFDQLKKRRVKNIFVLEGRPSLEAARVNAKELIKRKITPTIIADNMAGFLFYKNRVKEVWLSYQQANRDGVLSRIGALILAVLGKKHKIPVYSFPGAPEKKFLANKKAITSFNGIKTAPAGVDGYVPLVEEVPRKYISRLHKSL